MRLKQAVYQSSFEQMKRLEEKEVKKTKEARTLYSTVFIGDKVSAEAGYRFINKGSVNQQLSHMGDAIDTDFDAAFGRFLEEFDY